jgi:hypothetical protein
LELHLGRDAPSLRPGSGAAPLRLACLASGVIDDIEVIGASPVGIEVGSAFSVTFTVNDAATDLDPSPTEGLFLTLSDVSVSVGTASSSISSLDDNSTFGQLVEPPFEALWYFEAVPSTRLPFDGSSFLDNFGMEIGMDPADATGLNPNQVWPLLPGPTPGYIAEFLLLACTTETGVCSAYYNLTGTITSFQVVPEPGTASLLALVGLAAQRRRSN